MAMQLFPKIKNGWIKIILFAFKAHLAAVCLILLLALLYQSRSETVLSTLCMFSFYGGIIDFFAFIAMAVFCWRAVDTKTRWTVFFLPLLRLWFLF